MKEKPIIFSTPMVRAILDGRKTMTRRVIKPQPQNQFQAGLINGQLNSLDAISRHWNWGDVLWVRETWRDGCKWDEKPFQYRADYIDDGVFPEKWKSSMFMPREAARIFLEVTDVRVERLQKITEEDANAEGVEPQGFKGGETSYKWPFAALWDSLNAKRGYGWDVNPWVYVISFRRIKT